jgi:hypothetical protein
VVAIFHELVAAKVLEGYFTLRTGYRDTYDLWGTYDVPALSVGQNCRSLADPSGRIQLDVVLEFKYNAEDILPDVTKNRKMFIDIDLIVCWDFDEQLFAKQRVVVEAVSPDDVLFKGTNFKLVWPGAYNLGAASEKPLISLRRLLQDLQSAGA